MNTETSKSGADAAGKNAELKVNSMMSLESLEYLMYLRRGVHAAQFSSYDRRGKNADGGRMDNDPPGWLYKEDDGYVIFDVKGPGVIQNIWFTGLGAGSIPSLRALGRLRFYFDGEKEPRIDMSAEEFFSGEKAPFLYPLVGNYKVSSGGFYSFYPIPFAKSLKVVTENNPNYYHILYHRFDDGEGIESYTGKADYGKALELWNAPLKPDSGCCASCGGSYELHEGSSGAVEAGKSFTLFEAEGEKVITKIRLRIPEIIKYRYPHGPVVTECLRNVKGSSSFTMKLNPDNRGAKLVKRENSHLNEQIAELFVDGISIGIVESHPSPDAYARDLEIPIPESATAGKSSIRIEFKCLNNSVWDEFRYWIYSVTPSGEELTDEMAIGDDASEKAHDYSVDRQAGFWRVILTYPADSEDPLQPKRDAGFELLNNLWIKMKWDDEAGDGTNVPSVEAPLGEFFGSGLGRQEIKSLPIRVSPDAEGWFECLFPMPFGKKAEITIENRSDLKVDNIDYQVITKPYPGIGKLLADGTVGYFHATYNKEFPTRRHYDYLILKAEGQGHYVGVVMTMRSLSSIRYYLEGDERVFIDGIRTPQIYGTGTEDYYLGGWYFLEGDFTMPTHGAPVHLVKPHNDETGVYRFHINDLIPFYSSIDFYIEHGGNDDFDGNYSSVAFWYGVKAKALKETDFIDIGCLDSEAKHNYQFEKPALDIMNEFSEVPFGTKEEELPGPEDRIPPGEGFNPWDKGDDLGFENKISKDSKRLTVRLQSAIEGKTIPDYFRSTGRMHRGFSKFTAAILKENSGVKLRRLSDQCYPNQEADVYVDGEFAGTWYNPGYNNFLRWLETDFEIPARLTAGKDKIEVRIEWKNGSPSPWTEYEYRVYSYI